MSSLDRHSGWLYLNPDWNRPGPSGPHQPHSSIASRSRLPGEVLMWVQNRPAETGRDQNGPEQTDQQMNKRFKG